MIKINKILINENQIQTVEPIANYPRVKITFNNGRVLEMEANTVSFTNRIPLLDSKITGMKR